MISQALVPPLLAAPNTSQRAGRVVLAWAIGVASLALLARIAIPLPGTPVPMTGQTFGVALIALITGRRLGSAIVASYLAAGILGAPVFAHGASFVNATTAGYLVGMLGASVIIGACADWGWARSWTSAFMAASLGSVVVFGAGLLVLKSFVPRESLLSAGVYPFLLGDFLKNLAAASLARAASLGAGPDHP